METMTETRVAAGISARQDSFRVALHPNSTSAEFPTNDLGVLAVTHYLRKRKVERLLVRKENTISVAIAGLLARLSFHVEAVHDSDLHENVLKLNPQLAHKPASALAKLAYAESENDLDLSIAHSTSELAAYAHPNGLDHIPQPDHDCESVVSMKYGFHWIGIPKVGTRSFLKAFIEEPVADFGGHLEKENINLLLAQKPDYRHLESFTFVRNPWSRLVSCYDDKIRKWGPVHQEHILNEHPKLRTNMSFEEFVRYIVDHPGGRDEGANRHWASQHLFISDPSGELLVDHIGKLETIGEDFERIRLRMGLPEFDLPWLNSRRGWELDKERQERRRRERTEHYRSYYTPETRRLIADRYARDIELFGYEF